LYSKIISPIKDGKAERRPIVFHNKGSALRLGNYLEKELDYSATPDGKIFFNQNGEFTKNEMVDAIDNNVKGLRAEDDKFYSLVLSPSKNELEHIGNDTQKLKDYTIACMENYAENFNILSKNGEQKPLNLKDLVWFANIEQHRTYKGNDAEVKQGIKKQGEPKEGLQTHVHITVSARDKAMKITLNPRTNDKSRFSILKWSEKNQATFDKQFGFDSPKKSFENHQKQRWNRVQSVENMLSNWQKKLGISDKEIHRVRQIAILKDYSSDFRNNLKEIGKELKSESGTKTLKNEHFERLLNSKSDEKSFSVGFENNSFDLSNSYNQGYYFLKGAELAEADGKDLNGFFKKFSLQFRKRMQNIDKEISF
jgi:hypothetical protein